MVEPAWANLHEGNYECCSLTSTQQFVRMYIGKDSLHCVPQSENGVYGDGDDSMVRWCYSNQQGLNMGDRTQCRWVSYH